MENICTLDVKASFSIAAFAALTQSSSGVPSYNLTRVSFTGVSQPVQKTFTQEISEGVIKSTTIHFSASTASYTPSPDLENVIQTIPVDITITETIQIGSDVPSSTSEVKKAVFKCWYKIQIINAEIRIQIYQCQFLLN